MIGLLQFAATAAGTVAEAVPFLACLCVGACALGLMAAAWISERPDSGRIAAGFGASALACIAGSVYGMLAETYSPLCVGPAMFAIVLHACR